MRFEWDPRKDAATQEKHGFSFTASEQKVGYKALQNAALREYVDHHVMRDDSE